MTDIAPIILVSPDMRPSVMGVARSLSEGGLLSRFVTTVAFSTQDYRGGVTQLSASMRRRIKGREIPAFLGVPVETFPARELIRQAAVRMGLGDVFSSYVWEWAETRFDHRVASTWAGRAPCLYGCEHASVETFRQQKRAGGFNLLWQVIAHHRTVYELLREEYERFPDAQSPYQQHLLNTMDRVNARKDEQFALADLIVCNSAFSRQSFLDAGFSEDKVVAVPTGCPTVTGVAVKDKPSDSAPLIFLCAGTQSIRKGIPYLLEAWRRLQPQPNAELWLVGKMELPARLLANLPDNVRIRPAVARAALQQIFEQASVLVLPTLGEGLAHIILEALAAGLAVITTENSGCGDLVENGVNGWKVPIRDIQALADRMTWCLDQPRELVEMQRQSVRKASEWQAEDFRRTHLEIVRAFLASKGVLKEQCSYAL